MNAHRNILEVDHIRASHGMPALSNRTKTDFIIRL